MKKLILAFLMALPCLVFGQVATQKVGNTAVIYGANSPVTFNAFTTFNGNFTGIGADYLLPNQTLTGGGSILNRDLGDLRYSPIGATTTNSNTFSDGSTNSFYDLFVRNTFQQTGATASNLLLGVTTISNKLDVVGAITGTSSVQGAFFNGTSTIVSSTFGRGVTVTNSTTATVIVRTTAKAEAQLNVSTDASLIFSTNGVQTTRYGVSTAANSPFAGLQPGDSYLSAIGANRIGIGANSVLGYTFNGTTHLFGIGNVIVSNNVQSLTNNSVAYEVGGLSTFTGSVTNMSGTGTSNVENFVSGLLRTVTTIP